MKKATEATAKFRQLMKIGGVPLALILLLLNASYARDSLAQSILQSEVSLGAANQPLEEILHAMEKSSTVRFTYSVQKVDVRQKIDLPAKRRSLATFLKEVLDPLAIRYQVFNNRNIVLSQVESVEIVSTGITLSGTVYSQEGEPIQFANVLLQQVSPSDNGFKGSITDEFGEFSIDAIQQDTYRLMVSYVGYRSIDTTMLISESIDLGIMSMIDESTLLDGISVTARRRLIRQELDRLVLDVENSMLANRGSAMDVLASTPGISVQNESINMIGKSAVGIMVDERLIDLAPQEVANYLRSIPSEDILKIEVISNPPARYEAEGNSGLINIVLKKARSDSWNASIRSGYSKRARSSGQLGANFSYNKDKLSFVSSLFLVDGKYVQEQDDYAYFPDGLWYTSSPFLSEYQRVSGRMDVSYQLTSKWSIGSQYIRNSTNYLITDNPLTQVFDNETNDIERYLLSNFSEVTWKPRFNSVNLNSSIDLDTAGRKVDLNVDFFKFQNEDIREYVGESVINNPISMQHYSGYNANIQDVDNISASVDVSHPTKWATLGYGAKLTRSISANNIALFNSGLVDEEVSSRPLENNDFRYTEDVGAAYVSVAPAIGDKFSMRIGARLEATETLSSSENLQLRKKNDYVRLFPTFFLNYKQSADVSLGFSYGRRISRPNFGQLNPNVFFINPFQTIVGNAFLQPSFTDNVEFSTTLGNLTTKLYISLERDVFTQVPLPDVSTNVIVFTNENYVNTDRYGASAFFVFDKYSWWTSSNSADINYSTSTFDLPTFQDVLKGTSSSFTTSNDISIPQVDGLSLNLSYRHTFAGNSYIFETLRATNFSTAIQYQMLDGKMRLSLGANDIFKDSADRLETTVNDVFQTARYYYDARSINFNVVYRFGNTNISVQRHETGNADERNRTGN